jgi:hypothetical protein
MSNGGLGSGVYLREGVGVPAQLVVQSPGYRQVICDPTPAMRHLLNARLRGEYPGTPEELASEFRVMLQQEPETPVPVAAGALPRRRAWWKWFQD